MVWPLHTYARTPPANPENKWCIPPKSFAEVTRRWPPAHPFPPALLWHRPSHPSPTHGHEVSKLRCPPIGSLPSPHSTLSLQDPEADNFSAALGSHLTSSLQISLRRDLVRSRQQDQLIPGAGLLPTREAFMLEAPFPSRWIYEKPASIKGTFPPPVTAVH